MATSISISSRTIGMIQRGGRCLLSRRGREPSHNHHRPAVRTFLTGSPPAHGSLFAHLEMAPPDPILNTAALYNQDTDPRKVNLGIGAYRTTAGVPHVLPVVKKAEEMMLAELGSGAPGTNTINKEYLPVDGLQSLKSSCQKLIFGESVDVSRLASVQTLSGTGSLRVLGEFLTANKVYNGTLFYSDPTWGNHPTIFEKSGLKVEKYPYYDAATKSCKFDEWLQHVENSEEGSLYLIHPCAHNPTGVDPTVAQWQKMVETCKRKKHLCILDSAYQGYASGSLEKDREAIELFLESGMEFFVCQSFAKNLGLYGERIGMLHMVCENEERAKVVLSQLKLVIRPMYSSPPCHGAHLVSKVLNTPELYGQWKVELKEMADRILSIRATLRAHLEAKKTPGTWNHITDQIGMFSFTGLSPEQCTELIEKHHIYLLKTGRISLAGLNENNIEYVADCIHQVVAKA